MSLVEMLVSMLILTIIMASFFLVYFAFSRAGTRTVNFAQSQGTVRNVMRALESDVRSADPLLLVPSSFTSDANGSTNFGTNGTSPTDVIALYDAGETYAACTTATTPTTVVTPSTLPTVFAQQNFAANVIWAYDPGPGANAHTLIRYSYCTSGWKAGMRLRNVVNTTNPSTVFSASQNGASALQVATPTSTTVPNQASPVCSSSLTSMVMVSQAKGGTAFKVQVNIQLPNQLAVAGQGCH